MTPPDRDPHHATGSQTPEPHASASAAPPAADEKQEEGARATKSRRRRPRKQLPLWQETILLLVIALALAVVIKALFVQAFYIPSGSMNDTLVRNDRILVQKVSYWHGQPQRGDIVVFSDPGGWLSPDEVRNATNPVTEALEIFGLYPTGGHLVKRVIGIGGDHVVCCDDQGRITVNGTPLHEKSYVAPGVKPSLIKFHKTVPPGDLWVQGDNRANSADSRLHMGDPGGPFVPVDDVVGKVFVVVWPFDHATVLSRPATYGDVPSR